MFLTQAEVAALKANPDKIGHSFESARLSGPSGKERISRPAKSKKERKTLRVTRQTIQQPRELKILEVFVTSNAALPGLLWRSFSADLIIARERVPPTNKRIYKRKGILVLKKRRAAALIYLSFGPANVLAWQAFPSLHELFRDC